MSSPSVPPERLWLILSRCHRVMAEYARMNVHQIGLGLSDFAALEALYHKGPLPATVLADKVLLTSGSMTAAINRLAAKGLVERQTDKQDRRIQHISITDEGRRMFEPVFQAHREALAEATAALTAAEREQLAHLLRKLGLSAEARLHSS